MRKIKLITGYSPGTKEEHNAIKNSKNMFIKLIAKMVY